MGHFHAFLHTVYNAFVSQISRDGRALSTPPQTFSLV